MMLCYNMFYDRKSQTGSAGLFGSALIYTVETFKHTLLIFLTDSDSCITHRQKDIIVYLSDRHTDKPILHIIADRIIAKIIDQIFQHLFVAIYITFSAL